MAESMRFEAIENEGQDGKILLQFLSGHYSNRFKMESLGRLCIVKGRYRFVDRGVASVQYVEFSLDCAESISVRNNEELINSNSIPAYLKATNHTVIRASEFPLHLPIDSLVIEIINADYWHNDSKMVSSNPSNFYSPNDHTKNVCIMRAQYTFRKLDTIRWNQDKAKNSSRLTEAMIDKITLCCFRVTIPKYDNFRIDVQEEEEEEGFRLSQSRSPAHLGMMMMRPEDQHPLLGRKNTFSHGTSNGVGFSSSSSGGSNSNRHKEPPMRSITDRRPKGNVASAYSNLKTNLYCALFTHRMSIEFFLYFLVMLAWLIVRSKYHHDTNTSAFNQHTLTFAVVSFILIFSFRGLAMRVFVRLFRKVECNGRSFFVNGWSAWSYCGAVLQGHRVPVYSMPSVFVRAFHDGGVGSALPINLGLGEIPYKMRADSLPQQQQQPKTQGMLSRVLGVFSQPSPENPLVDPNYGQDYIASDMFTVLAEIRSKYGVVVGFLSQKNHFGCVAVNREYDRMSVHLSCDGVLVDENKKMTTDWLLLYTVRSLVDPFKVYMHMSSLENRVLHRLRPFLAAGGLGRSSSTASMDSDDDAIPTSGLRQVNNDTNGKLHLDLATWSDNEEEDDKEEGAEDEDELKMNTPRSGGWPNVFVPLSGWCSWYHYFGNVNEKALLENLQVLSRTRRELSDGSESGRNGGDDSCGALIHSRDRLSLFQIDDGYQSAWGDWLSLNPKTFPSKSLTGLTTRIKENKLIPGLWMAPFACDKHSELAKKHPDWILKRNGSTSVPANSGHCGKWFYGLDVTKPSVANHITQCIQTMVEKWGFSYLKLDFLYAAVVHNSQESLSNRYLTSAEVLQLGMNIVNRALQPSTPAPSAGFPPPPPPPTTATLRAVSSNASLESFCSGGVMDESDGKVNSSVYVLGCGAPLGSVLGHVHANRISPDAGLSWNPEFPLPWYDTSNLPCARNMIRNTLTRLFMHNNWWVNDPDCMLLRSQLKFTDREISAIITVKAMCGGAFILSDDLKCISPDRFRLVNQVLPPTNIAAVAVDLLEREMPELLRLSLHSQTFNSNCEQRGAPGTKTPDSCYSNNGNVTTRDASFWENSGAHVVVVDNVEDLFGSPTRPGNSPVSTPKLSKRMPSAYGYIGVGALSTTPQVNGSVSRQEVHISPREMSKRIDALFTSLSKRDDRKANSLSAGKITMSLYGSGVSPPTHPPPQERGVELKLSAKSFVFTDDVDIPAYKRDYKKLLRLLELEREARKEDLHTQWFVFAVCNWGNEEVRDRRNKSKLRTKTHFVHVNDIFGKDYLKNVMNRNKAFSNMMKAKQAKRQALRDKLKMSMEYDASPHLITPPGKSSSHVSSSSSFATHKPQSLYVMHLFNFWEEVYSHKTVTLGDDGEEGEVMFEDIPEHSASIFSVGLYTDPTLPKYIGSNLHFSCGCELKQCYMSSTPLISAARLEQSFDCHLLPKYKNFKLKNRKRDPNGSFQSDYLPVMRTMVVKFSEEALKDSSFGGYVWIYLPLNSLNKALDTSYLLNNVDIVGTAIGNGSYADVTLEAVVNERDCKTLGGVFKIAVCAPARAAGSPVNAPSSAGSRGSGGGAGSGHQSNGSGLKSLSLATDDELLMQHELVISWVMDIVAQDVTG